MNISLVSATLSVINSNDKFNTNGICETVSVIVANTLVSGEDPAVDSGNTKSFSPLTEALKLNLPTPYTHNPDTESGGAGNSSQTRAYKVWRWLKFEAKSGGVYLFAQDEDHCYNFVKNGNVYLIDASTQIYRKINTPGDASCFSGTGSPYAPGFHTGETQSNTDYGFNYLSPQPLDDEDALRIYCWGTLHQRFR